MIPHFEDPLNTNTVDKYVEKVKKRFERNWDSVDKLDKPNEEKSVAIVMGSGTWDLLLPSVPQGRTFDNHLDACRRVIEIMREYIQAPRFEYGKITLVWKSPVAHHMHQVIGFPHFAENEFAVKHLKYASVGRSQYLYTKQKALMEELGVPFLDI